MSAGGRIIRIGGHEIEITRPEKVLFPAEGITKLDMIEYYRQIARWMLPHVRGRPVVMECYPDGISEPSFLRKAVPSYFPDWIERVTVKKAGGSVTHVVCNNEATLVYLANQACITPHVWLSRIDRIYLPDLMVFDLDPSGEEFSVVKSTAEAVRAVLEQVALPAYVKTTGSLGLHVAVPLKREEHFDFIRAFARHVAEIVVEDDPQHRTLEQRKDRRRGRIFVDTARNAYAQTIAPAYAVRARPTASVSVPLAWKELGGKNLRPDGVTIRTALERLRRAGDPWEDLQRHAVSLKRARRKLQEMYANRRISSEKTVQSNP